MIGGTLSHIPTHIFSSNTKLSLNSEKDTKITFTILVTGVEAFPTSFQL